MPDKPTSPFQRLDTSLLRSTRETSATPPPPESADNGSAEALQPARSTSEPVDRRTGARTHAQADRSKQASTSAPMKRELIREIYRKMQMKQHLTGYTFRFRSEDLQELDSLYEKLRQQYPRLSKNDIPRIALDWLLADYKEHEEESVLAQVLARM